MNKHPQPATWSLWTRALMLALALAVGAENFRCYLTIRFTHAHPYNPSAGHSHPEMFGRLTDGLEMPLLPSRTDPMEHTHLLRDSHEPSSVQVASSRIAIAPPASSRSWRDTGSMSGPIRFGDPLFRPPC